MDIKKKMIMEREIKFRGLRVDGKGFICGYGVCVVLNEDLATIISFNGSNLMHSTQVTPESVGQFTGLQDKNGVDIYEGDRLFIDENRVCVLTWHNYQAGFDLEFESEINETKDFKDCRPSNLSSRGKVIGNIHEN